MVEPAEIVAKMAKRTDCTIVPLVGADIIRPRVDVGIDPYNPIRHEVTP